MNKDIQLIEQLKDAAIFGKEPQQNSYTTFGFGDKSVVFDGEAARTTFKSNTSNLYTSNKQISKTYSKSNFIKSVIELLRLLNTENRECQKVDIQVLYNSILNLPLIKYNIFYEIGGIEFNQDHIFLGEFKLYNLTNEFYRENFNTENKLLPTNRYTKDFNNFIIQKSSEARDFEKALEVGNINFESFESVLNFLIGDIHHKHCQGIFNFYGWRLKSAFFIADDQTIGMSHEALHSYENTNIGQYINNVSWQIPFRLITKNDKNEIEKRLLNSIEWIGKATYERDLSKSLVQFTFAIEGLLQNNTSDIITPSIMSQIGDTMAFILGKTLDERIEVVNQFKTIYKRRSAIAHGASNNISKEDVLLAYSITRKLITAFLLHEPFKNFQTSEELHKWIVNQKFN